jgi:pimeloyl-ACP methyl ester carboxylesterase
LRAAPQAWNGWIDAMRDAPFPEAAARIAVPTLVVAGGRDVVRDEETLRRDVADQITGAQFAVLPGSGHLPHRRSRPRSPRFF